MNTHPVHKPSKYSLSWLWLLLSLTLACNLPGLIEATPTLWVATPVFSSPTYTPNSSYTLAPGETLSASGPSLYITQNAKCRSGPSTAFGVGDILFQGQTIPLAGRNDTNTWFQVKRPSGDGFCWVSAISVTVQGDLNGVAIVSISTPNNTQAPAGEVKAPKASPTFESMQGIYIVKPSPTFESMQGIYIVNPSPTP